MSAAGREFALADAVGAEHEDAVARVPTPPASEIRLPRSAMALMASPRHDDVKASW